MESPFLVLWISHLSPCNNSPLFNQPPLAYICSNQTTIIDLGATDPDGDSLHYMLDTCRNSGIQDPVNYNPGYSPTSPLGPNWFTTIDASTGELAVFPVTNGIQVTGIVCVRVLEYRNGNLIGETVRDLQIEVIPQCGPNQAPQISSLQQLSGGNQPSPYKHTGLRRQSVSI